MRNSFFLFLLFSLEIAAQETNDLLVYSIKGTVTVTENNLESKLKIGKLLRPSAVVRTWEDAKLTMVCKQGKALSITREGVYPVNSWKDSCIVESRSLVTNYFQYIWTQLYVRSPEGEEEEQKSGNGYATGAGAPLRSETEELQKIRIDFSKGLDTIHYAEGDFPISWLTPGFQGRFLFQLFNATNGKLVFSDSVSGNRIMLSAFKKFMQPGQTYRWLIGTKGLSIRRARLIRYLQPSDVQNYIDGIVSLDLPEEPAAVYFRLAFFLEHTHYLAEAYAHYLKAVELEPGNTVYSNKLDLYCREYRLPCMTEK